jgi:peroxiredoxin Q/BCP
MKAFAVLMVCLFTLASSGQTSAATGLKVGDVAPDFTLQASDGRTYKTSDFRNKQAIVLAWFPRAYTSGCTLECKPLAKKTAEAYGVLGMLGMASRWTFYIGKDAIDKNVKPATSAEDMAAKLHELGVSTRGQSR